jgi:hypothetical protein
VTVHLTLCGTSIITNLAVRVQVGPLAEIVRAALPNGGGLVADTPVAGVLLDGFDSFNADLRNVLDESSRLVNASVPTDSAELSAVSETFDRGDRVVLLASDSSDGVVAAMLNAQLLAARERLGDDQIAVWATRLPTGANLPDRGAINAIVHVIRIVDLDAATAHRLHLGIASMLRTVVALRYHAGALFDAPGPEWLLHLSGGYKAVLPYALSVVGLVASELGHLRADVHFAGGERVPVPIVRWLGDRWVLAANHYDANFSGENPALYSPDGTPTPLCLALREPDIKRLLGGGAT